MSLLKKIISAFLTFCLLCVCLFVIGWNVTADTDNGHYKMLQFLTRMPFTKGIVNVLAGKEYSSNIQDTEFDDSQIKVNDGVETDGYTNIVLFGIDSRSPVIEAGARSDSILILSINNKNGDMKLTSLYRDTYLKIGESEGNDVYNKCNAAFANGGAAQAMSMINENLDLDIKDYVIVNFFGITDIVNMFGGVDVNITDEEMMYLNKYVADMTEESGLTAAELTSSGDVHLDGVQTTAYCRIRYTRFYGEKDENGNQEVADYDFGRTARQRNVLKKLTAKAKNMEVPELLGIVKKILNLNSSDATLVKTSLTSSEITELLPCAYTFNLTDCKGFPFELDTPTVNGSSLVVAKDLAANVKALHEYLFEDYLYSPSEKLTEISDYIKEYTGVK